MIQRKARLCVRNETVAMAVPATAPGAEVIVGSVSAMIPFFIASYIFGSRIVRNSICPWFEERKGEEHGEEREGMMWVELGSWFEKFL